MQKDVTLKIRATYETLGELTEKTEVIWVVYHGFGQLAKYFIKRFDILDLEKCYVIAPQGLSKFYMDRFSKVGASWLTRESKEIDLENQLNYVQAVFEQETQGVNWSKVKLNIMGFSQGTATSSRWIAKFKVPFDKFIFFAGTIAHDVSKADLDFMKPNAKVYMIVGDKDEFITTERIEKGTAAITNQMKAPNVIVFDGVHKVDRAALKQAIKSEYLK